MTTITISQPRFIDATVITKNGYTRKSQIKYDSTNIQSLISELKERYKVWYTKIELNGKEIFDETNTIPYSRDELEIMLEIAKLSVLKEKYLLELQKNEQDFLQDLKRIKDVDDINDVNFGSLQTENLKFVSMVQSITDYLSEQIDLRIFSVPVRVKDKLTANDAEKVLEDLLVYERVYRGLDELDPNYDKSTVEFVCDSLAIGTCYSQGEFLNMIEEISSS